MTESDPNAPEYWPGLNRLISTLKWLVLTDRLQGGAGSFVKILQGSA
jgi:hypothetical protein